MRKLYILPLFVLFCTSLVAQTVTKTNDPVGSTSIDANSIPIGVTFSASDFSSGCQVSDVDVRIRWAKTDGDCVTYGTACSFHGETSFNIIGPTGNDEVLVPTNYYGGCETMSAITTLFNQGSGAPTIAGGTPQGGTFGPAGGGNLNDFNGTSAFGTWNLIATDAAGGDHLCVDWHQVVVTTVADVIAPTISAPASFSVNATSGQCGTNVSYSVSASDLCGVASFTRTAGPASGSFFSVGTTTVTHLAVDTYGNNITRSFTVTVVDDQAPVVTCPGNITTNAAFGTCSANVSYSTPTATDNCSVGTPSLTAGQASGSSFSVGATVVTYTATDPSGNTGSCSFTVTVNDNQNPNISCPSDISVNATTGTCAATVTYSTPSATDNCPGVTVSRTAGPASGNSFPVGVTTVTHLATDGVGNTNNCSFTVTVTDTQNPQISGCPSNINVGTDPGQCNAVVSWAAPSATDNCPGVSIVRTAGQNPGSTFATGTIGITYTATDLAGLTATCNFSVTVTDTQDPSITCPANINVSNNSGQCGAVVTFANASFTDNCPGVTVAQTAGQTSGNLFSVGSSPHTVSFTATDAAGNSTTCSFTITVVDSEAPQFLNCPSNVSVNTANGPCTAVVNYSTLLANDNCPGTVTLVQTAGLASGSSFPLGVTTVTHTATDIYANVDTCTFTVTVVDAEAPQLNCPSDQTVTFDANCQYNLLNYTGQVGSLTDNCDNSPTVSQSPAPGTTINGSTAITITASDVSGNSTSCTFFVNPNDVVNPTITCPADQQVPVNSICQFTLPNYTGAVVSDDCDPSPDVTQTPAIGSVLTSSTPVTLTVTDGSGNSSNCTFNAIPLDATDPTITCPPAQLEVFDVNCEFDMVDYTGLATTADNCDPNPAVTQNIPVGTTISSTTAVILTATDASGNTRTCTFNVVPDDNTDPQIQCPNSIPVSYNALCQFTLQNYTGLAVADDNCDSSPVVTQSPVAGTSIGGTTTVVLTATDASGNDASCSFSVIPSDNSAPNVSCPANQLVNFNSSCQTTLASYTGSVIVSDNCDGSPTVTQSPAAATVITGTTVVTITATDDDLNANTCTFSVIPQDVTPPSITCGANLNVTFNSSCQYSVGNYIGSPTVSDNCGTPTVTQSPSVGTLITGTTTITLTATDGSGNTANCTFSIIPTDSQLPTISCPSNQNVNFSASCNFALADYTGMVSASDNCDPSLSITQSPGFGSLITGTTTVTLTATDDAGNANTCTFSVIPADNTNPTITCPGNQTENFTASCNLTLPDYTGLATANDNCDNSVLVTQFPAPAAVITGNQVITLTAVDDNANSSSCTFSVLPIDNANPTISCPANIPVNLDAGCQFTLSNYTGLATAADNCGAPTVTQVPGSGTVIGGTTVITLTATDGSGNTANCIFSVIPSDVTDPTITCPADQTVSSNASCQFLLVDYTGVASVADNCDLSIAVSQSPAFGNIIAAPTTVTLTAQDDNGNTASCTFLVTPADNDDPNVSCPGNQLEAFDADCAFELSDYTPMTVATDNCSATPTVVQSPVAGTVISGQTTITMTVTDADLNTASCTFEVIPEDDTDPVFACPSNATVPLNASCQFVLADYTASLTVTDNCDNSPSVVQSPVAGSTLSFNTTVTITATDLAGNATSCSFNVFPEDVTDPVVTCPANVNVNFTSNCEFTIPDYTGSATFSDNCDNNPFITQSPGTGTIVSGATTVTFTVIDDAGNTETCSFNVNPLDNQVPTVTCPGTQTVPLSASCDYTVQDFSSLVVSNDNCDTDVQLIQSPAVGSTVASNTTITYTGIDDAGNSSTCTFMVVLQDQSNPTITCPADQNVNLSGTCAFVVQNYIGLTTSSDNCDPSLTVSQSPVAGSLIGGATVVTVSAIDDAGNIGTCSFNVIPEDNTDPVILACPVNITQNNNPGICGALTTYNPVLALDNCDGVVVPALTTGQASGTVFPVGVTTVTHVATDGNGNTASCSFTVTIIDNEDPIIICPANISVNVIPSTCGANVTYALPTVVDNCTSSITPTLNAGLASGANFPVGTTTVTYDAVDAYGNSASCSFTVTVADDEAPVITCPADMVVDSDPGNCDAVVTYALPTVTDNCTSGIVPLLTSGLASGGTFDFGVTTVSYQAEDASGNTHDCSFTVTVEDNEDPVITCPADISVFVEPTTCQAVVSYADPTVTDNCNPGIIPALQSGSASGSSFALGTETISYLAEDGNGNSGSCSFTVTVVDNEIPQIACPADQLEAFDALCQLVLPDYTSLATTTDNCDLNPVVTQSPAASALVTGVTIVTLTSTDFENNSNSCTFTVTDNTPPVVNCPADQTVGSDINCQFTMLDYTVFATSTDNCGATTMSQVPAVGSVVNAQTTVTVTAEDNFGNTSSCQFEVIIIDNIAPSITCIGNQLAFFDANCMFQLPDYTGQSDSEDNCDVSPVITQSPVPGSMIAGASPITLTATDDAGNASSCVFSVNPIDVVAPTITCPSTQVAQFNASCQYALDDYTSLAVTDDNCSSVISVSQTPAIGTVLSNTAIVTLTAQDQSGNTTSCLFLVAPEDNVAPVIVCPSDLLVDLNQNCEFSFTDLTGLGTVTDNCSNSFTVTQSPAIGSVVSSTTAVVLTANDGNGNSSTCTFNVIPEDNIPPAVICAADIEVDFDANCQFEVGDYSGFATATDNCSGTVIIMQSPAAGTFISGTQAITLTADDGNGNTSNCSFLIIPSDATPPTIVCPADQQVSFNQNCNYPLLNYTGMAVATDNCASPVQVTQDVLVGAVITSTTVVTLTANDGLGNTASCSFSVIPSDNTDPVKMLELSITVNDAVNGYMNSKSGGYLTGYNTRQEFFIYQLLDGLRSAVPLHGMRRYMVEVETNIASSGLSTQEQAPLLMATALGKAGFDYWTDEETQTLWEPFLSLIDLGGSSTVAWLLAATMEAALLSAKRSQRSSVVDTTATIGADAVSVLAAGIGLSAAFVCFQLLQAPAKP